MSTAAAAVVTVAVVAVALTAAYLLIFHAMRDHTKGK